MITRTDFKSGCSLNILSVGYLKLKSIYITQKETIICHLNLKIKY